MKVMLDCSPAKIAEYSKKYNYNFAQLRTPLTNYKLGAYLYAIDNGCFSTFKKEAWIRLLDEAKLNENKPQFVCSPDVVGNARRTLELFPHFLETIRPLNTALVLQDGIGNFDLPWLDIDAVFIGGSDAFKVSEEAFSCAKTAKILGKWVHVGRVNTAERLKNWLGIADSIDGSGISRFDHMLDDVMRLVIVGDKQMDLLSNAA